MPFFEILLLALSMSMDAFAVCLAAGSLRQTQGARPAFRLSFHFGLFQFIMPVLGWLAGATIAPVFKNYDHWVVFGLLGFIGVRMIYSAMNGRESNSNDPSRGVTLVLLSIAVSIDALAVGMSLGLLGIFVWYPAIIIGVVTGVLSLIGLRLGNSFGSRYGKSAGIIGGLVLIAIGAQIVISSLLGSS
jgi:manganese efflux pump family protein